MKSAAPTPAAVAATEDEVAQISASAASVAAAEDEVVATITDEPCDRTALVPAVSSGTNNEDQDRDNHQLRTQKEKTHKTAAHDVAVGGDGEGRGEGLAQAPMITSRTRHGDRSAHGENIALAAVDGGEERLASTRIGSLTAKPKMKPKTSGKQAIIAKNTIGEGERVADSPPTTSVLVSPTMTHEQLERFKYPNRKAYHHCRNKKASRSAVAVPPMDAVVEVTGIGTPPAPTPTEPPEPPILSADLVDMGREIEHLNAEVNRRVQTELQRMPVVTAEVIAMEEGQNAGESPRDHMTSSSSSTLR